MILKSFWLINKIQGKTSHFKILTKNYRLGIFKFGVLFHCKRHMVYFISYLLSPKVMRYVFKIRYNQYFWSRSLFLLFQVKKDKPCD